MGRKQVYTDEQIVKALVETKGMVYLAASRVGCNPDTIYTRAAKSKPIRDAIRNERGKVVDTAELKLFQAILRDEPWAIRMTLMTIGKDRGYVEPRFGAAPGDDGEPVHQPLLIVKGAKVTKRPKQLPEDISGDDRASE